MFLRSGIHPYRHGTSRAIIYLFEDSKMAIVKTAVVKTEVVALTTVIAALTKAKQASASVLASCKEAALGAEKQLNPNLPIRDRIEVVMIAYRETIGDDINVRSNFKDALTLLACAQAPVSIVVKGEEVHTTGREALDMPKHAMKAAAKAVRDDNGLGRREGAGRKPSAPKVEVSASNPPAALTTKTVDARKIVIATVVRDIENAEFLTMLKAALAEAGYTIAKKRK